MSTTLGKRVSRYLDASYARGAFEVNGSFIGLSPDAIADEMAAAWDAENGRRGSLDWRVAAEKATAADILPHVKRWFELNEIVAGVR